jgi:2-oxoglutarate dehydrogenase E1 component
VVLCSGKVYYDLLEDAEKRGQVDVAMVRVEQLYPFPREELSAELKRYGQGRHGRGLVPGRAA